MSLDPIEVCSECYLTSKMHPDNKCLYQATHYEPIRCCVCKQPVRFYIDEARSYGPGDPVDFSVSRPVLRCEKHLR